MKNKILLFKNWGIRNLIFALLFAFINLGNGFAQNNCYSIIFRAKTVLSKPIGNSFSTMNGDLNSLLASYQVTSFTQARPDGKTQKVRDLYEIKISNSDNIEYLFSELKNNPAIDDVTKVCDFQTTCQGETFNDPLVQGNDALVS